MVYLDTRPTRQRADPVRRVIKLVLILAILAFGWFALTVGTDRHGRTEIVEEPVARSL